MHTPLFYFERFFALPEIWDKMAEIIQITIQYGDQIQLNTAQKESSPLNTSE